MCYNYAIQKAIANNDCIVVLSCFILCLCYWDTPRCESGSICLCLKLLLLAETFRKVLLHIVDGRFE